MYVVDVARLMLFMIRCGDLFPIGIGLFLFAFWICLCVRGCLFDVALICVDLCLYDPEGFVYVVVGAC